MHIKDLVGAGDRIMVLTLPFAVAGLAANIVWRSAFRMGLGAAGTIAGVVLLAIGVPLWITSVVQILVFVPKGKLITSGPFGGVVAAAPACTRLGDQGAVSLHAAPTPSGGSCAPSESQPTGALSPTSPTTICCIP